MVGNARRVATAVGYVGGSAAVLSGGLAGLLVSEAKFARRKVIERTPVEDPPTGNGIWGRGTGKPIVMAVIGDSSAVGLGVDSASETPGVVTAAGLSYLSGRPVRLCRVAISGAESKDLDSQVTEVLGEKPDLALIMIGANDVTSRTKVSVSVQYLADAVRRLRHAGVEVVVGTCPDLGTVRPIPQPLRVLGRRWSRQLAAAQVVAVVEAGGRTVSLGDLLGPYFARNVEFFSADGFHPSAAGYSAAASVMLPSVADALGYWPISRESIRIRAFGRDYARPIATAAQRASQRPGSEVTASDTAVATISQRRGPLGLLRKLLPIPMPAPSKQKDVENLGALDVQTSAVPEPHPPTADESSNRV